MAPLPIMNPINALSQAFPPKPHFTESSVPDLTGRVALVTGANTGVGREVAQVLYNKNATVWVASRSEEKGRAAIETIKQQHPSSSGVLKLLKLDLADLTTIGTSAKQFLGAETRLDLLFNNAGVMTPPEGSKTKQGYELQLGTNCVGHFLFTKHLTPLLQATAKTAPKDSVRVIWVSSSAADAFSPTNGFDPDNLDYNKPRTILHKYGVSKAGNYYHNAEFARRYKEDGIVSVALNPGNLHSELDRTSAWWLYYPRVVTCYPPINGAYTELFAAFSPDITIENSGIWVVPWGRFMPIRPDLQAGALLESEGGTGMAEKFWVWSEEQIKPYL
ncbi:short-chain alcohol dehydrogenase [Fusarium falciforme]|uniref:Short-chain alcohol dehydrogenase n=1 Tax=Fusarium falciforme TaxID=195108 RepID=A0A9W8UVS0_9HYPO|nr:short-chain alcohol dehydrogenase [Fusarium falciforme]KAJ4255651.1 short-chain alcohol dehydrogenase [Fusarium falciforme]